MGFSLRRNPDGVCRKNTSMNEESITYRHIRSPKVLILGEPIYFSDRLQRGRSQVSTASRASGRTKRGARGRTCKRAYDNRHYVSRRNFTGHRFLHIKRADYVMPDYRMTVRICLGGSAKESFSYEPATMA